MNALNRLWNLLSELADSLSRTKELIDLGNTRLEQSLGLNEPQVKLLTAEPIKRAKKDA